MLGGLFNSFLKLTNPTPRFTPERCLLTRYAVGGCSKCQDVCPHNAIDLSGNTVTISEVNCTGCGLCTQVCPSGALEFDIESTMHAIHKQQGAESTLACSQLSTPHPTLKCLARVTPASLVAAGAWNKEVTLLHGDCAGCPVGGPEVLRHLMDVVDKADQYREATGQPLKLTLQQGQSTTVENKGAIVSRRGIMGSLLGTAKQVVADLIPEQPLPFVDWSDPRERIPTDWIWRKKALKPSPAPDTEVYWVTPQVNDECNFCPVCMNVCPTEAIKREITPEGDFRILLEVASCTGCGACIPSCPQEAMLEQTHRPFSTLSEVVVLKEQAQGPNWFDEPLEEEGTSTGQEE